VFRCAIVEAFDEGEYVALGLGPCGVLTMMDELCLESMEEALHRRIVEAIGLAAHRGGHDGGGESGAIGVRGILHAAVGMVDQSCGRPLSVNRHRECGRRQFGAQVIAHGPADDLAAVEIHDGGEIQPALVGWNVGDVGEPDAVGRRGREVAIDQVRRDRQCVAAVGRAHAPWRRHNGADAVPVHQPLDPPAAGAASLRLQSGMDARAAIASAAVPMDPPDRGHKLTIGCRSRAARTQAPSVIAGRRDLEHATEDVNRIGAAMILDETEAHVRVPAKIAIDFFKMSRSMRSRSFSRRSRAISAAWSADGSAACVMGRRGAAVGSCPPASFSTQRRNTESRRPSSFATEPTERPLETTSSTACRL
jgi:hypothetical protein